MYDKLLLMSIVANWDGLMNPINDMLNGLFGNPLLIGLVGLLFFLMIILTLKITFIAMTTIMFPLLFIVFMSVPQLQIIIGIMVGILIGLGLVKWVRR